MPVVTVVIPTYNCAEFIREALESIFQQTLQDWEVIVVDDGSTDGTQALVKAYKDSRVRYIYQKNRGLPGARNTGIRLASTPYVAFLDADDMLAPDALDKLTNAMERDNASWCCTDVLRVRGEETEILRSTRPPGDPLNGILDGVFMVQRAMFFRRSAILEAGMYDESMRNIEDWELNIRIVELGKPYTFVPEPLYIYRYRPGSIVTYPQKTLPYLEKILRKHHKRLANAGNPIAAKIYARRMWALARDYFYLANNVKRAAACAIQSLLYDLDLRRLLHPAIHRFRRLASEGAQVKI